MPISAEERGRRLHQMNHCTCETVLPRERLLKLGMAFFCPVCQGRVQYQSKEEFQEEVERELGRHVGFDSALAVADRAEGEMRQTNNARLAERLAQGFEDITRRRPVPDEGDGS